jgi:uncharacterized sulfatase
MTLSVAGIELQLFAAPGETEDALLVWFPAERVLFGGDDLYRSFPNIYPVRGTGNRDILQWCDSLKLMRSLEAEVLVPGHTDPFLGQEEVHEVITNYHDALEFLFRRTTELMNEGKTADELAREVKLPAHLAELDYLKEYYGNVSWTVRNIYNSLVGWYDGNPLHLCEDFGPKEEAERMAALVGGKDALLARGREALASGDAPWAARLADHVLALDSSLTEAKLLKADALDIIGETILTATGRNYALSIAQKLRQSVEQA